MQFWCSLSTDQKIAVLSALGTGLCFVVGMAAVIFTVAQIAMQRKANELQIFETVFLQIRDAEQGFIVNYLTPYNMLEEQLNASGAITRDEVEEKIRNLKNGGHASSLSFFNTIEYLAFLIRRKYVKRLDLADYYGEAFVFWHDELFKPHAPDQAVNDPKQYTEFKALVKEIKSKRKS